MRRVPAAAVLALPVALGTFSIYAALLGPRLPPEGVSLNNWALGTIIIGVFTTPIWAMIAAVWIMVETELVYGRAARRVGRGRCPACDYPSPGPGRVCPECGSPGGPTLSRPLVQRRAMRRAVAAVSAGFLLGCISSEAWVLRDALAFQREAKAFQHAGGTGMYWRACRWPRRSYSMHFSAARGFWVND